MGNYDRFQQRGRKTKPGSTVHPIWRGIGCMMLILIPLISYAAADVFSEIAPEITIMDIRVFPYSSEMYGTFYPFREIGILPQLWRFGFIPINIVFTIMFTVIGFMIFSLVYAVVFRVSGPPKYGPTDAPPPRKPRRKRRR